MKYNINDKINTTLRTASRKTSRTTSRTKSNASPKELHSPTTRNFHSTRALKLSKSNLTTSQPNIHVFFHQFILMVSYYYIHDCSNDVIRQMLKTDWEILTTVGSFETLLCDKSSMTLWRLLCENIDKKSKSLIG